MTKTDKIVYSSFLEHALQLSCYGELLPQTYYARFFSSGVTSKSLSPIFGAQMSM